MRDDLVNRQHRVRRHQHEILQAHADRLGGRHLDRFAGDPLGALDHLGFFGDFPAAGLRHADEVARLDDVADFGGDVEGGGDLEGFLFDVRAFARGEATSTRW